MNHTEARDWAEYFENKEKSELLAMPVPEGLSKDAVDEWWQARERAIDALEGAAECADDSKIVSEDGDASEPAFAADEPLPASRSARTRMLLDEIRAAQQAIAEKHKLVLPQGDAAQLLERQLASGAALIGYLSDYIARSDTNPDVCMSFMDRMTAMLGASANVGRTVGRLRGQVSRTEQQINVSHSEGGRRGRG
ncbi:MAG TPA: hypothetical protein VGM36_07955 [Rhizomicrobium sp.]